MSYTQWVIRRWVSPYRSSNNVQIFPKCHPMQSHQQAQEWRRLERPLTYSLRYSSFPFIHSVLSVWRHHFWCQSLTQRIRKALRRDFGKDWRFFENLWFCTIFIDIYSYIASELQYIAAAESHSASYFRPRGAKGTESGLDFWGVHLWLCNAGGCPDSPCMYNWDAITENWLKIWDQHYEIIK